LLKLAVGCSTETSSFREGQIMQAAATVQREVTAELTLEPTVAYNTGNLTVTATVIATPSATPGEFNVAAPPISIPQGIWTVFWNLVSEDSPAELSSLALLSNPLPSGNVMISDSMMVSATQWQASIDNRVTSFNGFGYTIFVVPAGASDPKTRHDPTIAVTPDPPPGG
jgi:hypothetical protein